MSVKKQGYIEALWQRNESGFIITVGTHTALSLGWHETFLEIKEKANTLEQLYCENNVSLPSTCDLSRLIADAKLISDSLLQSPTGRIPIRLVYSAAHFNRIADVLIPLRGTPDCARFLPKFRSGTLDLFKRERSFAKNVLWELEMSLLLRTRAFDVSFAEPDIVTNLEGVKIAIACKKLYSDKHIQNVLSEAVQQIESSFDLGIVALNLDDLVPANSTLEAQTLYLAERKLIEMNNSFLARHDRHFRKYLASGRLLSVFVSTGVVVEIAGPDCRVHNVRRSSIWTIQGLPIEKEEQLRKFYERLML